MNRILLSLALLVVVSGCTTDSPKPAEPAEQSIPFRSDGLLTFVQDGQDVLEIDIEIADTDSSRARGLMERSALPDLSGMLFVFERAGLQSFYMANTPMSLDFFFIGADSVIVNTVKYASPLSLENINSTGPALWVLEVEAGFIDTYGIVAGDRVRWSRR